MAPAPKTQIRMGGRVAGSARTGKGDWCRCLRSVSVFASRDFGSGDGISCFIDGVAAKDIRLDRISVSVVWDFGSQRGTND